MNADPRRVLDFLTKCSTEFQGPDGVNRPISAFDGTAVLSEGVDSYDMMLVRTPVGRYLFDMKKYDHSLADVLLLEDPDVVGGKYLRNKYLYYLFTISENNGAWVVTGGNEYPSHPFLFKATRSGLEPSFGAGGRTESSMSGVILPKQCDVPENWVSYWDKKGYDAGLTQKLLDYCGCTGPFKVEYNAGGILGKPVIV